LAVTAGPWDNGNSVIVYPSLFLVNRRHVVQHCLDAFSECIAFLAALEIGLVLAAEKGNVSVGWRPLSVNRGAPAQLGTIAGLMHDVRRTGMTEYDPSERDYLERIPMR
jgi:hypothetical protein